MIETDILIIGAGPTGFICSFEAGLLKKCHILDALPQAGGQLSNYILKNLRYSRIPEVLAGDLVNLMEQIKQFEPVLPWRTC
jgi:thioredoxin reductase (NADPH)